MKTLIITPPLEHIGGVSGHFRGLKKYWEKDVSYFERYGKHKVKLLNYIIYPINLIRFLLVLFRVKPDKVIVNVSLTSGFFSNLFYADLAKFMNCKTIIFFHGWNPRNENWLERGRTKKILNNAYHILVLSNNFKEVLIDKNIKSEISVTTTKVSDDLIKDFNIFSRKGQIRNLLFVSRIEKSKGIYLALEVFRELYKQDDEMTFTIVGDGTELEIIKSIVKEEKIDNVVITGKLVGEDLRSVFKSSDIFLLLTSHDEGLPAALLEAMAFGLPVVTRPMGAIGEIVNENMGILSDSTSKYFFSSSILNLKNEQTAITKISRYNYNFIQKKFLASVVTKDLEYKLKL